MERFSFDLHTHSYFSDGDFSPAHVFQSAKQLNVRGLILTDHNTTLSIDIASRLAARHGLMTLEGIEITSRAHDAEIHLLGYAHHFNKAYLERQLIPMQKGYNDRIRAYIQNVRAHGYPKLTFDDVQQIRPEGPFLVKYDLIRALVKKTGRNAGHWLPLVNKGGPLYVPYGDWAPSPKKVLAMVTKAGGAVSFAHPGQTRAWWEKKYGREKSFTMMENFIAGLCRSGLMGLEINHISNNADDVKFLQVLAKKYRLLGTGGSDYHGRFHHPERPIGRQGVERAGFRALDKRLP